MRSIASEQEITDIIEKDSWMMDVLRAAEKLQLPDWWIGAGFLRNKIWDYIENKESRPTRDVDLVYFNAADVQPETDWAYDEKMKLEHPYAEWEIRNQARMHYVNDSRPFASTADGISHWVETATCVAVKLENGVLKYLFCYGTDDLFGLIARPVPFFDTEERIKTFYDRIEKKQWRQKWPELKVITNKYMNQKQSNLKRMDNIGIVVESLDEAIDFFTELGLRLEGRAMIEGKWAGRVTGLGDQQVEVAMMVTPDGHSRLELSRFLMPAVVADHRNDPVNALGYLRAMFAVEDLDDTVARLQKHGAELVGEIVQYEDIYRLCYIRGPEHIMVGLAEELTSK